MDFIDKQNRSRTADAQFVSCPFESLTKFLDTAGNGVDLPKSGFGLGGDEFSEGCLAGSRGSVEQNRLDASGADEST